MSLLLWGEGESGEGSVGLGSGRHPSVLSCSPRVHPLPSETSRHAPPLFSPSHPLPPSHPSQLKILRREIGDLLKTGKSESAAIRVETVLREEALLRAFDLLELYLELISVRAGLLEKVGAGDAAPPDMQEALSSVVYAAPRLLDVPELTTVRHQIQLKFGSDYVAEASEDGTAVSKWQVNPTLAEFLAVDVPPPAAKAAALASIAVEAQHPFDAAAAEAAMAKGARQPKPPPGGGGAGVTNEEFENAAGAAAAAREAADRAERAAGAASRLAGGGGGVPADRAALPSPPASKVAKAAPAPRAVVPPLPAAVPKPAPAAAPKPKPAAPEESSATSAPPPPPPPPTDDEVVRGVYESVDSVAAAPPPPLLQTGRAGCLVVILARPALCAARRGHGGRGGQADGQWG